MIAPFGLSVCLFLGVPLLIGVTLILYISSLLIEFVQLVLVRDFFAALWQFAALWHSEQQFWHHIKISSLPSSKVRRQTTEKLLRFRLPRLPPIVYLSMCQPRWQYSGIKTLKMSTNETKVIVFGAPTTRTPRLLIK